MIDAFAFSSLYRVAFGAFLALARAGVVREVVYIWMAMVRCGVAVFGGWLVLRSWMVCAAGLACLYILRRNVESGGFCGLHKWSGGWEGMGVPWVQIDGWIHKGNESRTLYPA